MLARTLIFHIAFYLNFVVQALVFSPVLLMPERFVWPIARFWARSSLWLHRAICGIGGAWSTLISSSRPLTTLRLRARRGPSGWGPQVDHRGEPGPLGPPCGTTSS
jgi:hypothetical protein